MTQPPGVRHGQRGQATAEFALAATLALVLLFGTVDFGRAMFTYDNLGNLARLGARYAMVHGSACSTTGCPATVQSIQSYVQSKATGDDAAHMTITPTWGPSSYCSVSAQTPGCWVNVAVSYPFHFAFHWASVTITASSQMIISQ